jgi:hypothetical protein
VNYPASVTNGLLVAGASRLGPTIGASRRLNHQAVVSRLAATAVRPSGSEDSGRAHAGNVPASVVIETVTSSAPSTLMVMVIVPFATLNGT